MTTSSSVYSIQSSLVLLVLLASVINFPIYSIGNNAIGIFDLCFLFLFLLILLIKRKIYFNFFTIFYFFYFIVLLLSSMRYVSEMQLPYFLYLLKFVQISAIPTTAMLLVSKNLDEKKLIFITLVVSFVFILSDFFINNYGRAQMPFLNLSSGPLGLFSMTYLFFALYVYKGREQILLFLAFFVLLLTSLSKSFILATFFILFFHALSRIKLRLAVKTLRRGISIFILMAMLFSLFIYYGDFLPRIIFLFDFILSIEDQTSFTSRISNHWFKDFDQHISSVDLYFGHGVTNIPYSYDSLYFFIFFTNGLFFGSIFVIFLIICLVKLKKKYIYFFLLTALTSGIFLETILISFRGIEPFVLLLSFFFFNQKVRSMHG